MRLTGSSQTIVTQGVSAMICSIGPWATAVPPAGTTVSVPDITFIVAILEPGGRPPGTPAGRAEPNLPEKPRPGDPLGRQGSASPDAGRIAAAVSLGWQGDHNPARAPADGALGPQRGADHGPAHRPLRADHAAGRAAGRHRFAAVRVRAVRPPASGGPALRRGPPGRAGAAGATALPLRRRDLALPARPPG